MPGLHSLVLLRVPAPDAARLVGLDALADAVRQGIEHGVVLDAREVAPLPLAARRQLLPAQLTLLVLDQRLLGARRVHVAARNGGGHVAPRAARLERALLLERRHAQRRRRRVARAVRVERLLRARVAQHKRVGPLAVDGVERVLVGPAGRAQHGAERVLLAADPALARVVDARREARRALDEGGLVQLDERRAVDEALDVQRRQRDEVVFVVLVDVQQRVPNLLDLDCAREGRFLGVVSLQLQSIKPKKKNFPINKVTLGTRDGSNKALPGLHAVHSR